MTFSPFTVYIQIKPVHAGYQGIHVLHNYYQQLWSVYYFTPETLVSHFTWIEPVFNSLTCHSPPVCPSCSSPPAPFTVTQPDKVFQVKPLTPRRPSLTNSHNRPIHPFQWSCVFGVYVGRYGGVCYVPHSWGP